MRPPGPVAREIDLDVSSSGLFPLGCSRGLFQAAVSATLGPATARPSGTLVATRSIEENILRSEFIVNPQLADITGLWSRRCYFT